MLDDTRLELQGSGWTARGEVVEQLTPSDRRAIELLQAVAGRSAVGDRAANVVARVRVERVVVRLANRACEWQPSDDGPLVIDAVLALGRVVGGRRRAALVAGDLPMAFMVPTSLGRLEQLYALVGIVPSPHAEPVLTPDGVVVMGSRPMPWDPAPVSGPFAIGPSGSTAIEVTPQIARLLPGERMDWLRSWQRFSSMIGRTSTTDGLHWMRLAVLNPNDIPRISFVVDTAGSERTERLVLPPGSLAVELSDHAPGDETRPQRSLLRLHPTSTTIEPTRITLVGAQPEPGDQPDLQVRAASTENAGGDGDGDGNGDRTWTQTAHLTAVFDPDPVALTSRLRRNGLTPTPAQGEGIPTLRTFSALSDGWLETTVPAVTDQDYVDRDIIAVRPEPSGLVEGAVVWGNDDPDGRSAADLVGRTRWSLSLLDATAFECVWTIEESQTDHRTITGGTLDLYGVSASLDGLWSIADVETGAGLSLPDGERWVGAIGSVALHRGASLPQRRPSAVRIVVDAEIDTRALDGGTGIIVGSLRSVAASLDRDPAVADALGFGAIAGTAWVRHATLPTVQALPLTESGDRAPSGTRELMPMSLTSSTERWTMRGDENDWLRVDAAALGPRTDWVGRDHLDQVLLSLPGAYLTPTRTGLRFGYRHDLPALDEAAAFASVDEPGESAAPADNRTEGRRWERLGERSDLAELAYAPALEFDHVSGTDTTSRSLPVADGRGDRKRQRTVRADLAVYPGGLQIDGDEVDTLGGISHVDPDGPMTSGAIPLVIDQGRTRDQMNVGRSGTAVGDRTIRVEIFDGADVSHEDTSLLTPFELTGTGTTWHLWFQGLPMRVVPHGDRSFDVDDLAPLAASDEFRTHRWNLSAGDGSDSVDLTLGGLEVHPVRLVRVITAPDGALREVAIDVRPQLPSGADRRPRPEHPGLVRLVFGPGLEGIRLIDPAGSWPIAHGSGDADGGVELRWESIALVDRSLVVGDVTAHFHLFDANWKLALDAPLTFPLDGEQGVVTGHSAPGARPQGADGADLRWTALEVTLDLRPDRRGHRTEIHFELRLGGREVVATFVMHPFLEHLTETQTAEDASVTWFGERLTAEDPTLVVGSRGVQFAWDDAATAGDDGIEFLPGATLSAERRPGVVAAGFAVHPNDRGWPDLLVDGANAEIVLGAEWDAASRWSDDRSVDRGVDPWYHGRLSVGYVGSLVAGRRWESEFLLDGVLSTTSVISFAGSIDPDRPGTIASVRAGTPSRFTRHRATILFQQHRMTDFAVTEGTTLVGLAAPIELVAVVEHSLEQLEPFPDREGAAGYRTVASDRFAVPQKVRLLRPTDAQERLARLAESPLPLGGFTIERVRRLLDAAYASLPDDAIVIDAPIAALISRAPRAVEVTSILRTLPAAVVRAARASIDDHLGALPYLSVFEPDPPLSGHVQLNLPFLAAIGAGSDADNAQEDRPSLLVDPVDQLAVDVDGARAELAAMLACRALSGDLGSVPIGDFGAQARTFTHVAEDSVVANWNQLARPNARETAGLDSILASEPDALGRSGAPESLSSVIDRTPGGAPRPNSFVAFDSAVSTGSEALVEFDFRTGDRPRGTLALPLERHGAGWSLRRNGLTLASGGSKAPRDANAVVAGAARPLIDAIRVTGSFSVHLRVAPAQAFVRDSAAIVSLSSADGARLFTIAQHRAQIEIDIRNASKDRRADRSTVRTARRGGVFGEKRVVDIVYVYDGTAEQLFVDGEPIALGMGRVTAMKPRRRIGFTSWTTRGMQLMFGNQTDLRSRWTGRWEVVAWYAGVVTPDDAPDRRSPAVDRPLLPWSAIAAQIDDEFGDRTGDRHHVAAALLPSAGTGAADLVPSPYVTFGIDASAQNEKPEVIATLAELLAETDRGLASIGGMLWGDDPGDDEIERWANTVRLREAARSRRTIVRLRRVEAVGDGERTVSSSYAFLVLAPEGDPTRLGWRALPLRADRSRHRHPEWQFRDLPATAAYDAIEVAAPLISGVVPVRDAALGVSGIVVDAVYSTVAGSTSAVGGSGAMPVWYGLSHHPQFAESTRPGALDEPEGFDAPPRIVLAPVAPDPALPEPVDLGVANDEHAVAVDAVRYIVTGSRPGGMNTMRALRQRSHSGHTYSSATLPVHIRAPRPLPLGFSADPARATRTWGGLFDRQQTVWVLSNRCEIVQIRDEAALLIEITSPDFGTIARDRTDDIEVVVREVGAGSGQNTWDLSIAIEGAPDLAAISKRVINPRSARSRIPMSDEVRRVIGETPNGEALNVVVEVTHSTSGSAGPQRIERRVVALPLVVAPAPELPLIVEPRFCRFEDPEYNRRISTAVASTRFDKLSVTVGNESVRDPRLVISRDRAMYVPGAPMVVGVWFQGEATQPSAQLAASVKWGPPDNEQSVEIELEDAGLTDVTRAVASVTLPADIAPDTPVRIVVAGAGTTTITADDSIELSARIVIVEEQEQPATTAAYALLRRNPDGSVSCPRYALRPTATRTELVDRLDVFGDIMRYRAEFHWIDTVRARLGRIRQTADDGSPSYEVQKISANGETHIPPFMSIS
jgi:hypothetical protein